MATFMPQWTAYEMRLMAERYVSDGMIPQQGDAELLARILGRPLHTYGTFAERLVSHIASRIPGGSLRPEETLACHRVHYGTQLL